MSTEQGLPEFKAEPSQAKAPACISLQQVSQVYRNGTLALQSMNLTVAPTQFISLVGPSGCGKSTVLRLMAGLMRPSSGTIAWGEKVLAAAPPAARVDNRLQRPKLAFVFQEPALMPWATVTENVELPLKLTGRSQREAEAAVQETIALVGLKGFERAYPRQLSGGMKMRVSIARALVTQPEVLLMDEPFGALDEMTRGTLNTELLNLWNNQRWTVVFVTHNIYEAVYLSQQVLVMAARPGRVIGEFPIAEPYPRTEDFRTAPLFNQYCRDIKHCLMSSGQAAPAPISE